MERIVAVEGSKYDALADEFMKLTGMKAYYEYVDNVELPPERRVGLYDTVRKFRITLKRNDKIFEYDYIESINDYREGIWPELYNVLSVIESYPVEDDVWDFIEEFGYKVTCKKEFQEATRIWEECNRQYKGIYEFLDQNDEYMDMLREMD